MIIMNRMVKTEFFWLHNRSGRDLSVINNNVESYRISPLDSLKLTLHRPVRIQVFGKGRFQVSRLIDKTELSIQVRDVQS